MSMGELWERMNARPEDGDRIGSCCINCGCNYPYHVGVDKDRSMGRCPVCYADFETIHKTSVAGSLRVNNKEVRDTIARAIDLHTPYTTFIEERVGDIWIYRSSASTVKEVK